MFRLDQEKEDASFYFWLTLTYSEDYVPRIGDGITDVHDPLFGSKEMCFSKTHCREFFERLRSRYKSETITFKHFLVSEYGPNATERPHYHCLLMAYGGPADLAGRYKIRTEIRKYLIEKAWPYGFVNEKTFHGRVLSYLTKYCTKPEMIGQKHTMKPFTLISRGIGLSYLSKLPDIQKKQMIESLDFTVRYGSSKMMLPRYHVDKLLPHFKQDLIKTIPEDPVNGSWIKYEEMIDLRRRFEERNNKLVHARALQDQRSQKTVDDVQSAIKKRQRHINTEMNNFKSKIKQRKDL